jgi:hypothetical protein
VLKALAHDDEDDDHDFNPHHMIERFIHIPPAALRHKYHGHALTNDTCEDDPKRLKRVPPSLLATYSPGVGLLLSCDTSKRHTPLYRFAPDRGWTRR